MSMPQDWPEGDAPLTTAHDLDGDGYAETLHVDAAGDGYSETVQVDTNLDGYAETRNVDTDLDGRVDLVGVDTDADGGSDAYSLDADRDGVIDQVGRDADQNGILEEAQLDQDGDGHFETRYVDANQNGTPEVYDSTTAPAPRVESGAPQQPADVSGLPVDTSQKPLVEWLNDPDVDQETKDLIKRVLGFNTWAAGQFLE